MGPIVILFGALTFRAWFNKKLLSPKNTPACDNKLSSGCKVSARFHRTLADKTDGVRLNGQNGQIRQQSPNELHPHTTNPHSTHTTTHNLKTNTNPHTLNPPQPLPKQPITTPPSPKIKLPTHQSTNSMSTNQNQPPHIPFQTPHLNKSTNQKTHSKNTQKIPST